jgi:hypothetical protein
MVRRKKQAAAERDAWERGEMVREEHVPGYGRQVVVNGIPPDPPLRLDGNEEWVPVRDR